MSSLLIKLENFAYLLVELGDVVVDLVLSLLDSGMSRHLNITERRRHR